jgi:hypothetical protein
MSLKSDAEARAAAPAAGLARKPRAARAESAGAGEIAGTGQLGPTDQQHYLERFADFERGVLHDNIVLCDIKCGVLLAFTSAMAIYALNAMTEPLALHRFGGWMASVCVLAFFASAMGFLVSCSFSLATVMPRILRDQAEDHIFWGSAAFQRSSDEYLEAMDNLDVHEGRYEKLRHLHTLAGICRAKFANLARAMNFAILGFVVLVVAELAKGAG